MGTFVSLYPGGSAGLALIVLRWSLTAELCFSYYVMRASMTDWEPLVVAGLALALFLGLATQVAALVYVGVALFALKAVGGVAGVSILLTGPMAISLAFSGPGAFSVDARLYGRREISLDV